MLISFSETSLCEFLGTREISQQCPAMLGEQRARSSSGEVSAGQGRGCGSVDVSATPGRGWRPHLQQLAHKGVIKRSRAF